MKIALVSPYDWTAFGGVNSHLSQLSREFRDRGHDIRILAPASTEVADPIVTRIGRPFPVPAGGSSARIALSPRLGREVRAHLEREQFDIVHVHEPLMPSLPIQVLRTSRAANPRVVNVGTFHARKEGGNKLYSYGRRLLKRWYRELDGKIAVSAPAAQYVGRYFNGFYNIIPNGIDVDRFDNPSLVPIEGFDDGLINILYVGRAEKRKGLGYLIRAFGMVNARNPETRLVIVGPDSRAKRKYAESVASSGQRNVEFIPGPSDADLPRYHRTAQIFCSPATGNESQGIVLLEGMSAGLPVVASNIEGYASVITHGVDGTLVPPKDPLALADALTELVNDEQRRRTLGAAGRQRVEDYSWPRVTQQVMSYYERLLDTNETVEASRRRGRSELSAVS